MGENVRKFLLDEMKKMPEKDLTKVKQFQKMDKKSVKMSEF